MSVFIIFVCNLTRVQLEMLAVKVILDQMVSEEHGSVCSLRLEFTYMYLVEVSVTAGNNENMM